MNVRTENLPILQDFVPYRGRCPKSKKNEVFDSDQSENEQIKLISHPIFNKKLICYRQTGWIGT